MMVDDEDAPAAATNYNLHVVRVCTLVVLQDAPFVSVRRRRQPKSLEPSTESHRQSEHADPENAVQERKS